jgi:hypothetical protein
MVLPSHDTKKGWTSGDVTSNADYLDYAQQNTSFEQIVPWMTWYFNLTGDGIPDRVLGGMVGWNFFQTLGAQPLLGRTFLPRDAEAASSHVAIRERDPRREETRFDRPWRQRGSLDRTAP